MSANDIIILSKGISKKDPTGFTVTHKDIEDEKGYYSQTKHENIHLALQACKDLQDEQNPEYGIYLAGGF